MKIGDVTVKPLAAESMGVRSLCTSIITPDVSLLLDPSAALAFRPPYEPHPLEYSALEQALNTIEGVAQESDILTISHYHFDHVRPGATNQRYNLSTREGRLRLYGGKRILLKDGRTNINPSQRRRAYYFERDLKETASIEVADSRTFEIDGTRITFSEPLPHGSDGTPFGFVLATLIEHDSNRILFCPDVQGPLSQSTLDYILSTGAKLIILGGPPIYLTKFSEKESKMARFALNEIVKTTEILVVDHHLLRSLEWRNWLNPVVETAKNSNHSLYTMAELAGEKPTLLEATRDQLYHDFPPSDEFMNWINASDEYKFKHRPPFSS